MPSNSKPSATEDLLPTSGDTKGAEPSPECVTCKWLFKQQDGIQRETLRHLSKFHPPK